MAAASPRLLGPPWIHSFPPPTVPASSDVTSTAVIGGNADPAGVIGAADPAGDPAVVAAVDDPAANPADDPPQHPPMGLTENCSPTFLSSGDPCLDFFFQVVPDTKALTVNSLLEAAWVHDPLTALKLVCHLRGVRGTGKSDRKNFYAAALWLHANHPKSLALNAAAFADFGYLKDLPEILHRLVVGPGNFSRTRTKRKETEKGQGRPRRRRTMGQTSSRSKGKKARTCKSCRCKNCRCTWKCGSQPYSDRYEESYGTDGDPEMGSREGSDSEGSDSDVQRIGAEEETKVTIEKTEITDVEKKDTNEESTIEKRETTAEKKDAIGESTVEEGEVADEEKKGTEEESTIEKKEGTEEESTIEKKEGTEEESTIEKKVITEEEKVAEVERLAAEMAKVKIQVEEAANRRHEKRAAMAAKAVERYASDPDYRLLHDQTSDLFAVLLSSDLQLLNSGDMKHFSLAAKWCPSIDSSYDRSTLLCETIARRVFPRDSDPEYLAIEERHYVYRVRERLRKEVLVPLRKALKLPEVYICAGQLGSLSYTRVASVAMKNYKDIFMSKDKERFSEFLGKVKDGKAKIAAGALLPHEIVAPMVNWYGDEEAYEVDEVAELQWKRMVSDLLEKGKMSNCIAVCDVSGSMSGTPMEVSIALGLLISELTEEPWKGRAITFSEEPQLHLIEGESLKDKVEFVKKMDWGGNTDFQKVFDQILDVAVKGKLEADKMIKRLFVFSDMEFDQASCNSWETDYQAISRKFQKSAYPVPEIVFWNLRDTRSTPVPSGQKGVALVSGFSKNLMKIFLESDGVLSPKDVMDTAIAGEEYQKLVVFD